MQKKSALQVPPATTQTVPEAHSAQSAANPIRKELPQKGAEVSARMWQLQKAAAPGWLHTRDSVCAHSFLPAQKATGGGDADGGDGAAEMPCAGCFLCVFLCRRLASAGDISSRLSVPPTASPPRSRVS